MGLRGAIASLAQGGPFTVKRRAVATIGADGMLGAAPAETTFEIVASIQPVTGREQRDLPEGRRGDEVIVIYTITEVAPVRPGFDPDRVTYEGEDWVIWKAEVFKAFGEVHYRAYASRTENP